MCNTCRFAWTDAAVGRDADDLVTAEIELFRNGDVLVVTNGVLEFFPRELPFPHDGYGQDDEWVSANFTNATEIAAAGGYAAWVDAQVGEGLLNGLYKLTVALAEEPPETTFISVGDLSVAVTNAGEYSFLLEKGEEYALSFFPPSSNITISAVDDVAATRGPPLRSGWTWGDVNAGNWVADVGMYVTDYFPGMSSAYCSWLPTLCGSPDVLSIPDEETVRFYAHLLDYAHPDDVSFEWSVCDGLVAATPDERETDITVESGPSWSDALVSVVATLRSGFQLFSWLDFSVFGGYDPQPVESQVHLALNVPDAILLNSNAVSIAKIAAAGWMFSSDVPTSGTVRVSCLRGGDKVSVSGLVGEWTVAGDISASGTIEGIKTSASVGDVVFRMEFCCGDATNAVEKEMTVVQAGDVMLPSAPADGLVVIANTPVAMQVDCVPQGAAGFLSTMWHTRRLKTDGTHDTWQLASYGQSGSSLDFTPTQGGIYQIRALASVVAGGVDERFYVWDADENIATGMKMRGDLKSFGVCDEQWQINLRNCAKSYLGVTDYALLAELDGMYGFSPVSDGDWKCNYFVAHRIREVGLPLQAQRHNLWRQYPPLANEWAGSAQIAGWQHLEARSFVQPGFIVGHPSSAGSGHVGVVDFDGEGIAAGAERVNRKYGEWLDGTSGFSRLSN